MTRDLSPARACPPSSARLGYGDVQPLPTPLSRSPCRRWTGSPGQQRDGGGDQRGDGGRYGVVEAGAIGTSGASSAAAPRLAAGDR